MMKKPKVLEERIRRVTVLFKELGVEVTENERSEGAFTAAFDDSTGMNGGFCIDEDSRFLEIGYTFSLSLSMAEYLRERLEEMLRIAYEYGCYINIEHTRSEIHFSLFTKIYYTGLSYYSLRDSLRDFKRCVEQTTQLLDINET